MKLGVLWTASTLTWAMALLLGQPVGCSDGVPRPNFAFGAYQTTVEGFSFPSGAVFDEEGRLYVAEAGTHRIRVLDPNGKTVRRWGKWGDRPGRLREPKGLAWVKNHLWVIDSGNHRVQVFTKKGKFIRVVGAKGKLPGQFFRPVDLAFDFNRNRVAIADSGNARIQILDLSGAVLKTLPTGSNGKPFLRPVSVSFDPEGTLYVVDRDRNVIDRFDAGGEALPVWGGYGPHFGLLDEPSAAVWWGNRLWVVDRRNHRLQGFHPKTGPETLWGVHEIVPHRGMGKLHYPDLLAIAPDGSRAVVGESQEHRLQIFAASPTDQRIEEVAPNAGMRDRTHFGSYLSIGEKLMVAPEPENHFVFLFDLRREIPIIVNKFGDRGTGFGLINRMAGLCLVQARNEIWCLDSVNRRVQIFQLDYNPDEPLRFDPSRTHFAWAIDYALLERSGDALDRKVEPRSLKVGRDGDIYVLDGANGQILRIDPETVAISTFFSQKDNQTQLLDPSDMAPTPHGGWWVVDRMAASVLKIDDKGKLVDRLGRRGKKRGRLSQPFGIAALPGGGFLLTDSGRDVVLRFNKKGRFQGEWGGRGDRMGQFWHPQGIAVDGQQRIFVIDQGNHRGQIFDHEGRWLVTFGAGRAYNARNVPVDKKQLPRK